MTRDEAKALFGQYKDTKRISASSLRDFTTCPFLYWAKHVAKIWEPEEKDYFNIGSAVDSLITQGQDHFDINFEVVKRRGGDTQKTQLTEAQFTTVKGCYDELMRQPLFGKFRAPGWDTQVMVEQDIKDDFSGAEYRLCGVMDFIHKRAGAVADLKTTANLDKFRPHDYAMQMAIYRKLAREVVGLPNPEIFLIAVDKTDLNRSGIWRMTDDTLKEGERRMRIAIEALLLARETNNWLMREEDLYDFHECEAYKICPHALYSQIKIC